METIHVDMKSLGWIAYDEYCRNFFRPMKNWVFLDQKEKDAWNAAAQEVADEHERRKPDPEEEV